jgi:hypothetical protein
LVFILQPHPSSSVVQIPLNKNVDIKLSARDAFLEQPSSGTLKIERLESQMIKSFGSNKTKGRKQDSQHRPRSNMPEGVEPSF